MGEDECSEREREEHDGDDDEDHHVKEEEDLMLLDGAVAAHQCQELNEIYVEIIKFFKLIPTMIDIVSCLDRKNIMLQTGNF